MLAEFWARLKMVEPGLEVFDDLDDGLVSADRLVPLYMHGDGGRTYKHAELMVVQFQPAIGHGSSQSRMFNPHAAGVSLRGHSFTTRFLVGVMQKHVYSESPEKFHFFLEEVAKDFANLYYGGIWHTRLETTFHFCLIGCKGDFPFIRMAAGMNRSFLNIRKRPMGRYSQPLVGCCWLCRAGTDDVPFEDVSDNPKWLETMGPENHLPWDKVPPFLEHVRCNQVDKPSFFKYDLLHLYHLGVGRDFAGSGLTYMLRHYQDSVPNSLEKMNADFKAFLKANGQVVHFQQFTRDILGYIGDKDYPVGHWSKATDTLVVVEFLGWLAEKFGHQDRPDVLIRSAAKAIAVCVRLLLESSLWMDKKYAKRAGEAALHFVQCYGKLAHCFWKRHEILFNLVPKLHGVHHLAMHLIQGARLRITLNPLAFATFQDEDFIGRVSRLSRRVSPRLLAKRTIQRYLLATCQELEHLEENGLAKSKVRAKRRRV